MVVVSEHIDPPDESSPGPADHSIDHARADHEETTLQENNCSESESRQKPLQNGEVEPENDRSSKEEQTGEEEEEECGFCLFMKSGPCRDSFVKWEVCVEEAEKVKEDIVEKCHQVTALLKECMESNTDYYNPILRAEKEMNDAALEEAATLQEGNASNESEVLREAENKSLSEVHPKNLKASDCISPSEQPTLFKSSEEIPRTSQQK